MIREAHLWGSEVELHYPNGLSTPEASNAGLTGKLGSKRVIYPCAATCYALLTPYSNSPEYSKSIFSNSSLLSKECSTSKYIVFALDFKRSNF